MKTQMPDVIVPPPPLPPLLPPDPPERDDPAEPNGQEDDPPPVLNRTVATLAGAYVDFDGRLTAAKARLSSLVWVAGANLVLSALVLSFIT